MIFIDKMPTKMVVQNDFKALFERCTEAVDDYHISMTYSDRANLGVWLRRAHPEMKLVTRQLGDHYELQHKEPRNYVIRFVRRAVTGARDEHHD